jgi:hypothetical protein
VWGVGVGGTAVEQDAAFWGAFFLSLVPKMFLVALLTLVATEVAERAGPVVGGLVASLPVSSGPAYFFLALDHDAAYIADAAVASFTGIAAAGVMVIAYVLLAQRQNTAVAVIGSLVFWALAEAGFAAVGHNLEFGLFASAAMYVVGIILMYRHAAVKLEGGKAKLSVLVIRGLSVAALLGAVETAAAVAGPGTAGTFAAVPITYIAMMVILQNRHGGPASAAVMAHTIPALVGLSLAFLCLRETAVWLGETRALLLALGIAIGWNGALLLFHLATAHRGVGQPK